MESEALIREAVQISEKINKILSENKAEHWKPYQKQLDFLNCDSKVAIMFGANRAGKTTCAAWKVAVHATGIYPEWYKGKRINRPNTQWVVGVTNEQMRNAVQVILLGRQAKANPGTGMIPKNKLGRITWRQGVPDCVDTIEVIHVSGGSSFISLMSERMGEDVFQGAEIDGAWIDEEVSQKVINEVDIRLMTTGGQMIVTFTPLKGMTSFVLWAMEEDDGPICSKFFMGWDDVTHLSEAEKQAMVHKYKGNPHELKARMTGYPTVGRGLIYPFPEEQIFIPSFKLARHWRRLGGLDPGFEHPTASVVAAFDDEADCIYVYGDYKLAHQTPPVHALRLKNWGDIDFATDPAANQTDKGSGEKLMTMYQENGVSVFKANNQVQYGIGLIFRALEEGKLFIFDTCHHLRREMKLYRYDEKSGKIVKKNDDCLDALRYLMCEQAKARVIGQRRRFEEPDYEVEHFTPFDPIIGV